MVHVILHALVGKRVGGEDVRAVLVLAEAKLDPERYSMTMNRPRSSSINSWIVTMASCSLPSLARIWASLRNRSMNFGSPARCDEICFIATLRSSKAS